MSATELQRPRAELSTTSYRAAVVHDFAEPLRLPASSCLTSSKRHASWFLSQNAHALREQGSAQPRTVSRLQ
jgi:RES domain-containing protein